MTKQRGRPILADHLKRTRKITICLSDAEYEEVEAAYRRTTMFGSFPSYLRAALIPSIRNP